MDIGGGLVLYLRSAVGYLRSTQEAAADGAGRGLVEAEVVAASNSIQPRSASRRTE